MKTFKHDQEIPWECLCTRPNYVWEQITDGKVVVDIDGKIMTSPHLLLGNPLWAVQLNYHSPANKQERHCICPQCGRYKHRIITNPFRSV